jgi:hypothetical protein
VKHTDLQVMTRESKYHHLSFRGTLEGSSGVKTCGPGTLGSDCVCDRVFHLQKQTASHQPRASRHITHYVDLDNLMGDMDLPKLFMQGSLHVPVFAPVWS